MHSRDKFRSPFLSDSQTGGFTGFFRRRAQNSERGDQKFVFIVRRMKKECKTCLIQQRPKRLALEGVSPLGEAYHWNSVADFKRRVASAADIKSIYSRLCVH